MPYERNPTTLAWLDARLTADSSRVRMRALELLEFVQCQQRTDWLRRALRDTDPLVRAVAALIQAVLAVNELEDWFELAESDFADGPVSDDLGWEWQYQVRVCCGDQVPSANVVVWTAVEDDDLARSLAVMRSGIEAAGSGPVVTFIVSRCYVSRFTRGPKNRSEAMKWAREGRPVYTEGEGGV